MLWYYVEAGKQAGPVEEAVLEEFFRTGRVQADTLVWREGMANWQPYRDAKPTPVPGASPPLAAPPMAGSAVPAAGEVVCAECGKIFPKDNVIQYGTLSVCSGCKPVFVQKLKEGAPLPGTAAGPEGPVDPEALANAIRDSDYSVEIGSCLSRGWNLVKANLGIAIGTTLLLYICMMACSFVPFIGGIVQMALQGPLMGGLYWFFLKLIRGQEATVGDGFSGFSRGWVQLMLASIVSGLLAMLSVVPAIVAFVVAIIASKGREPSMPLLIAAAGLFIVGLIPAVYLSVCWVFTLPLVVDKQIEFWPAMNLSRRVVHMHWGSVFGVLFVCGLIAGLGVLACGVGLLFTLPLFFAALMYAYEDIFGGRRALSA
jgi:hypothetical protein